MRLCGFALAETWTDAPKESGRSLLNSGELSARDVEQCARRKLEEDTRRKLWHLTAVGTSLPSP